MKVRSLGAWTCATLLAFAATARAACPPNQTFTSPASFHVGASPFNTLIADFNADGIPDLAITSNGASAISILLGIGNGSFHDVATYAVNPGNGNLIAADLDRDGNLDIATNSSGTDVISVLKGRGDGTFEPRLTYAAGDAPYGVASADFNGDGIPDLAAAAFLNGAVAILLGRPAGGYDAPTFLIIGQGPYALVTGDFNHDGIVDLVASNQNSGDISVLLGQGSGGVGDGTFATVVSYPVGTYPYSIAIADFDEDGISDLAVANGGSATLSILRGNGSGGVGNGTFATATNLSVGTQPRSVAAGDVDRDGITDLVFADYSGSVGVLFGLGSGGVGNGSFASPLYFAAGANPTCVVIGDLNADTLADLAVANYGTDHVSVLLHGCGSPPPPPPNPAPVLTAVRDVPNDQGGRVFVTWLRSGLDANPQQITGYRVWRRIPPAAAMAAAIEVAGSPAERTVTTRVEGTTVTYWEALITLPSERLEGYGYTAPTTQDSLENGNPYTAFFVTALTYDPGVFYESNIDSGYSVDNIPPAQPSGIQAVAKINGVALNWASNHEVDLEAYRVYRGATPGFVPGPGNLVASSPDTGVVDAGGDVASYYKVTALDRHGNEGPAAKANPTSQVGVVGGTALALGLRGATPNPSRDGVLTVAFTLPSASPARLEVIDLAGRRVAIESVGGLGAGPHTITLARGRPLPTGMYALRLVQAGRMLTAKVVVTR